MDCHYFRENIMAFAEAELPAPIMQEMNLHASGCKECRLLYEEFSQVARYIDEEKSIQTRPFAETRIMAGIQSRLDVNRISSVNRVLRLQPTLISLLVLAALAIGILIGISEGHQYTSVQPTDEQIESMRSDLNVPVFMDEDNTSLN